MMLRGFFHRYASVKGLASRSMTSVVDLGKFTSPISEKPLIQFYRNRWPDPAPAVGAAPVELPARTVNDEHLNFQMKFGSSHGSAIYYPHLKTNPADRKVSLLVKLEHMNLTKEQTYILIRMVGPRFNPGKKSIRLVCDQFQNRIENKRYLIVLLESLLAETRRLSSIEELGPVDIS